MPLNIKVALTAIVLSSLFSGLVGLALIAVELGARH